MAKSLFSFPILYVFLLLSLNFGILLKFSNGQQGNKWCVAKPSTDVSTLSASIHFACDSLGTIGRNCSMIQVGGTCYNPNTTLNHASYVMNSYYKHQGPTLQDSNCYFGGSGLITETDPSYERCQYE